MKNKYSNYYDVNDVSIDQYINMADYIKQYNPDWVEYTPETKEEKLAREKAEKRNDKIDQILG
jgi:hypothetical protein